MKYNLRRVLAMILCVFMLISSLPMNALAEAIEVVKENSDSAQILADASGRAISGTGVSGGEVTINVGDTLELTGTTSYFHSWSSSDSSTVSLTNETNSQKVTIEGEKAGDATITHTYYYNRRWQTETITVHVVALTFTGIAITGDNTVYAGATKQLTVSPLPEGPALPEGGSLKWESGDTAIATINADTGVVTGMSAGSVTITATYTYGEGENQTVKTATFDITVQELESMEITGETSVVVGNKITLSLVTTPEGFDTTGVVWESANEAVATVNQNGVVTGVAVSGTTTEDNGVVISATLGGITTNYTIYVLPAGYSAQTVYVYVSYDNTAGKLNLSNNGKGWATVGKITLNLPAPSKSYSQYTKLVSIGAIKAALRSIQQYSNNWGTGKLTQGILQNSVNWLSPYGLKSDDGASDYSDEAPSGSWYWHLDGELDLKYEYNVRYFYSDDGVNYTEDTAKKETLYNGEDTSITSYTDKSSGGVYEVDHVDVVDKNGNVITANATSPYFTLTSSTEGYTLNVYYKKAAKSYKVEHYLEQKDGTYTKQDTDTISNRHTGDNVTATAKTYAGYVENTTHEERVPSGVVTSDNSLVLKLYYDLVDYTVSYDLAGGNIDGATTIDDETYNYGDTVTVKKDPVKTGYTFAGWTTEPSVTISEGKFTMPASNVKLTAQWTAIDYNVIYNANGGLFGNETTKADEDNPYHVNDKVTVKDYTPVREGYELLGWATDANATEAEYVKSNTFDMPANNVTLYAVWNKSDFNVTYYIDGEQYGAVDTETYGNTVTVREEPEKEGYTFSGWTTEDAEVSEDDDTFTMPAKDVVFNGSYTKRTDLSYTVNYLEKDTNKVLADAKTVNNQTYGASVTEEAIDITGYDKVEPTSATITIKVEGNVINFYYTKRTDLSYTVNYLEKDTNKVLADAKTVDNQTFGASVTADNEKKAISGFTYSYADPETLTIGADSSKNIINLYYTRNDYTITYMVTNVGAEEAEEYQKDTYAYEAEVTVAEDPSAPAGYTFDGWYTDESCESKWTPVTKMPAEHIVVYGRFTANTNTVFTVKYWFEKQDASEPDKYEQLSAYPDVTKQGQTDTTVYDRTYELQTVPAGFSADASNATDSATINGDGTTVLNLYYNRNTNTAYKVEYYQQNVEDDEYSIVAEDTVETAGRTGDEASYTEKSYTGFELDRTTWTDSANSESETKLAIAGDGSLVIRLYYTRNSYKVSYKVDGAAYGATETYKYGEEVTVKKNPEKAGYTFSGWSVTTPETDAPDISEGTFTMPATNVVIEGTFTANGNTKYRIEYYQQNIEGTEYELVSADSKDLTGKTDTTATIPAKTYEGFTENTTYADRKISGTIAGDGSLVLRRYYDRNSYKVSYEYTNESVPTGASELPEEAIYKYGESVRVAEEATAPGYTFSGWTSEEAEVSEDGTFTMPAKDVVIKGTFTANGNTAYKVEYYYQVNGEYGEADSEKGYTGTTDTTATVSEADKTPAEEKTGYVLDESKDEAWSGTIAGDGSLVLKVYFKQQFTVTYKPGTKGTFAEQSTGELDYNAETPAFEGEKTGAAGYTFSGWSPEVAKNVTDNAEYVAQWTANENTAYKVEHYLEKLEGGYELEDTENLTGTTDKTATATPKTYTGFTYDETIEGTVKSGTIAGDGSLVLKLYYTRNSYKVSYEYTNESVPTGASKLPEEAIYKYGESVRVAEEATAPGYTFSGWTSEEAEVSEDGTFTMPAKDVVIKGTFTANGNTAYKVEYYYSDEDGAYSETADDYDNRTGETATLASVTVADKTSKRASHVLDESKKDNWSGIITGDGALVLKVYFKYTGGTTGAITLEKIWIVPEETKLSAGTITLMRKTAATEEGAEESVGTLTIGNSELKGTNRKETATIDSLPEYDVNGDKYTYYVVETGVDANKYVAEIPESLEIGGTATIINKWIIDDPESSKVADKETVTLGEEIVYTIGYYNHTNAPATITITDKLDKALTYMSATKPDGATVAYADGVVTWTLPNVPAYTRGTVTLTVKVNDKINDKPNKQESVSNTVKTTVGTKTVPDATERVNILQPNISIIKSARKPASKADLGDVITYVLEVENPGELDLDNVSVTDPMFAKAVENSMKMDNKPLIATDNKITIGALAAGEEKTITYQYKITENDILSGIVENTAKVTGKVAETVENYEKYPEVTDNCFADVETAAMKSELSATKAVTNIGEGTGKDGAFRVGDEIQYKITITNTGNVTAKDVDIADTLADKGENIQGFDDYVGDKTFDIKPGETVEILYSYTVAVAGEDVANALTIESAATPTPVPSTSPSTEPQVTPTAPAETTVPVQSKQPITITADSTSRPYDGTELTDSGWEQTAGDLTDGDSIKSVTVSGSITNYGEVANQAKNAVIKDADGVDRTGAYDITYVDGTLEITKRKITITVDDAEKYFDESDPVFTGEITEGSLVAQDDLGEITYRRTNTDEAVSIYEDVLTADYTENENYEVAVVPGNFTIKIATADDASVTAEGGEWDYDGEAHAATAKVNGAEGFTIYYKVGENGEWTTTAPSVTNVKDAISENATEIYVEARKTGYNTLTADPVTLTIKPRPVTIISGSAEESYEDIQGAPYNGTLTNGAYAVKDGHVEEAPAADSGEYGIEGKAIVKNETITTEISGSLNRIGTTPNTIEEEKTAVAGGSLNNYDIKYIEGELKVTGDEMEVEKDDAKAETYTYKLGETIEYTITVTNRGQEAMTDVVITEQTGNEITGVTGEGVTGAVIAENKLSVTIESIASGKTATITAKHTVTEEDLYTADKNTIGNTVKITAKYDGRDIEGEGKTEVKIDEAKPSLKVTKTAEKTSGYKVSDVVTYTIKVENTGNLTISGIKIEDAKATFAEDAVVSGITLKPGESHEVTATYTITEQDVVNRYYTNTATAAGTASNGAPVNASDSATVTTEAMNTNVSVTKTIDTTETKPTGADGKYRVGDVITYKITVRNEGNVTVKNIHIADYMKDGEVNVLPEADQVIEELAPNSSKVITYQYTVTEADIGSAVANKAVVEGVTTPKPSETATTTPDITPVPTPSVSPSAEVTASVQPKQTLSVYAASTAKTYDGTALTDEQYAIGEAKDFVSTSESWTLDNGDKVSVKVSGSATNVADTKAENNKITEVVIVDKNGKDVTVNYDITKTNGKLTITPATVKVVTQSGNKTYDGEALTAGGRMTGLVNGETAGFEITGSQTLVGTSNNTYTLEWAAKDNSYTADKNNYTVEETIGTLTITDVDVDPDKVINKIHVSKEGGYKLGDVVTFTIKATNIYAEKKTLTIIEQAGVTITGDSEFKDVAPGATVETTATYAITSDDIKAGTFVNTVKVEFSDGGKSFENTDTVETEPLDTTLTVEKTSEISGDDDIASLDETITYTITIKNDGNVPYKNLKVNEIFAGLDKLTVERVENIENKGNGAFEADELAVGATATIVVTYEVREEDILAGSVLNKVTAKADSIPDPENPDEPKTPENEDEVEDETDAMDGNLSVTKSIINQGTGENGAFRVGDKIQYKVIVMNIGNVTVKDVKLTDYLNGEVYEALKDKTFTLAPGEHEDITYTYTVKVSDVENNEAAIEAGDENGKPVNNRVVLSEGTTPTPKPENSTDPKPTVTPSATADATIAPRQAIEITAVSTSKIYDGQPLTANAITDDYKDDLIEADKEATVSVDVNGEIVEVGTTANVPDPETLSIKTDGIERKDNYNASFNNGTLTIYPRGVDPEHPEDPLPEVDPEKPEAWRVIIRAKDNTGITYDGKPHGEWIDPDGEEVGYVVEGLGLAEGHQIVSIEYDGEQTNAGLYEDEIMPKNAKIVDADGNDVTHNYVITYLPGDLEILSKEISVRVPDVVMWSGQAWNEQMAKALVSALELENGDTLDAKSVDIIFGTLNGIMKGDGSEAPYPDTSFTSQKVGINKPGHLYVRAKKDSVTNEDVLDLDLSKLIIRNSDGEDITGNYSFIKLEEKGDLTVKTCTLIISYRLYDNGKTNKIISSDDKIPYLSVGDTFRKWSHDISGYVRLNQFTFEPSYYGSKVCDPIEPGVNYMTLYYGLPRTSYTINYIYLEDPTLNKSEIVGNVAIGAVVSDIGSKIIANTIEGYTHLKTEGLTLVVQADGSSTINVYYTRTATVEIMDLAVPTGASLGAMNVGDCCE